MTEEMSNLLIEILYMLEESFEKGGDDRFLWALHERAQRVWMLGNNMENPTEVTRELMNQGPLLKLVVNNDDRPQ